MNLGELLKEQEAVRAGKLEKPVIPEHMKAARRYERDNGIAFLNYVRNLFIEKIEANEVFKPVRLPRDVAPYIGNGYKAPDDVKHPAHDAFMADFVPWAEGEGLRFVFKEQDDGCGMESWLEANLRPL